MVRQRRRRAGGKPSERRWRIGARVVLAVACLITLLCVLLFVAALRNDQKIAANQGTADAEVVSVAFDRTIVRYSTPDGIVHIPPNGVLYPEGLSVGQVVRIAYDRTEPSLAKVADRSAVVTVLPLSITIAATWLVAGPLLWWLRRKVRGRSTAAVGT